MASSYAGQRGKYIYYDDTGVAYLLTTTQILGNLADNGLVPFDQESTQSVQAPPKRFSPRHVYWETSGPGYLARKKLICGTASCAIYKSEVPVTITIDGQQGTTTGRVGEKFTY